LEEFTKEMIEIFTVSLCVLFVTAIGFCCIKWLNLLPEKDNLLTLGYSYGLGVGLISMQLYLYSRLNLPWDKYLIVLPWFIMLVLSVFLRRKHKFTVNFKWLKLSKIEYLLVALIILTVSYTLFEALLRPVAVWDGWAIWLLKSKIFFIDGKIIPSALTYVKSGYPLIISLLGTFIYLILGKVNDTVVLFASFSFYLFLGILFFGFVKNRFGTTYALLMTFLLLATQNLIRQGGRMEVGQADLALGYYFFICVSLLLTYLKKNDFRALVLLNIFMGITTLIKFEGMPFVFAIELIILWVILTKKLYRHIITALFWIIPIVDWQMFKAVSGLPVASFYNNVFNFSLNKTLNVFIAIFKELVNVKSWNLLWITYFFGLGAFLYKKSGEYLVLNSLICFQLLVYLCIYIFSSVFAPDSSLERLLVHVAPLVMLSLAFMLGDIIKAERTHGKFLRLLRLKR
jgi:hypothetical protein